MGDSFTPFANRQSAFVTTLPTTVGPSRGLSGNGPPEGVVPGVAGQTYQDILTSNLYLKIVGSQTTGWQLVGIVPPGGTGGGGAIQVFGGSANPNGVITVTGPAFYIQGNTGIWSKPAGVSGNTGWVQITQSV